MPAAAGDSGEATSWSAARMFGRSERQLAGRGRSQAVSLRPGSTAAAAPLQLDAAVAAAAVAAAGLLPAAHGGHCG